jgi:hypothetical protein
LGIEEEKCTENNFSLYVLLYHVYGLPISKEKNRKN